MLRIGCGALLVALFLIVVLAEAIVGNPEALLGLLVVGTLLLVLPGGLLAWWGWTGLAIGMRVHCVVCRRTRTPTGPTAECCTAESLLKRERRGFLGRHEHFYTLDGHPLTRAEVAPIVAREATRYRAKRLREAARYRAKELSQQFAQQLEQTRDLASKLETGRVRPDAYLQQLGLPLEQVRAMDLQSTLIDLARGSDTPALLRVLGDTEDALSTVALKAKYCRAAPMYRFAAETLLSKTWSGVAASIAESLRATQDVESVVAHLEGHQGWVSDSQEALAKSMAKGLETYVVEAATTLSDDRLQLLSRLSPVLQVNALDETGGHCRADVGLCGSVRRLASAELDARRRA